jgi:hypothetical protein
MTKAISYRFGERALSGFVRQKLNPDGELFYKGVIHLFGAKVPIYLSIEPHDKYVKGEKVYKVFTYLAPMPSEKKGNVLHVALGSATRERIKAIRKVEETVKNLGVVYEYQKRNEEKIQKDICKRCIKAKDNEWRERLREAVRSNVARQKEICRRKVQKLLARRKGNK